MTSSTPIELTVMPRADDNMLYQACWADGDVYVGSVHEIFLDLMAFMIARRLLEQGYNVRRLLIVRLQGAENELMRAPLGVVAATPLINFTAPVTRPTRAMLARLAA